MASDVVFFAVWLTEAGSVLKLCSTVAMLMMGSTRDVCGHWRGNTCRFLIHSQNTARLLMHMCPSNWLDVTTILENGNIDALP